MCLNVSVKGSHNCIENNMKANCPICHTDMFTSRDAPTMMECGHAIHSKCYKQYLNTNHYTCPICKKSLIDMTENWQFLDQLIANQPMPPEFANSKCVSLCNDCNAKTEAPLHFLGQKCGNCGSYNTTVSSRSGLPEFPQQNQQ